MKVLIVLSVFGVCALVSSNFLPTVHADVEGFVKKNFNR